MGIEEYKFLTKTLSDISSLSIELDSERKVLESWKTIKKQKEAEIGVLVEQLGSARKCSDEDAKTPPPEEMKNEIEEMESKLRVEEDALTKLKEPLYSEVAESAGSRFMYHTIGYVVATVLLLLVLIQLDWGNMSFDCVTGEGDVGPYQVLDGVENCNDGSDEWGDPDVAQQSRPANPTEAEKYLLDVLPEYESSIALDILTAFCAPMVIWVIFSRYVLSKSPFFASALALYPKKYYEEINRLETIQNSAVPEIAAKKAQMTKKVKNINYINNSPEKIEKENSELAKLEELGATQLMKVLGLESKIGTKWDSIRHLIPYSEMLDNQDS